LSAYEPNSCTKTEQALGFCGRNHCLGHQLARLEGRIALTELLGRFEHLDIVVPRSQPEFKHLVALRGLTSLPMRVS
jgi:cytochrome P450